MNVTLDTQPHKISRKRKILYISILVICLLAILISAYVLVFKNAESIKHSEHIPASEEEYLQREAEFEGIFSNETVNQINQSILITNKIRKQDEIIGTAYESTEKVTGKYSLDVKIPYININNTTVKKYNSQIEQIFKQKALDIINDLESKDVVYTVDYIAYINENNVLSIAIRSILKEGNNAQRTIIQTYNYDFEKSKEINLEDILKTKGLSESDVETKVTNKIKQEQAKVEELKKLGYNIFERDYTNNMYKVENTTEFFLGKDNFLYLIYAYGNDNYTSELDLVIF
jgi:hypothetical protein